MNAAVHPVEKAAVPPAPLPHPLLGVTAIMVGVAVSTLTSRLTSVGLADIRGAVGAGFDEGAWITTAFTAAQMLVGPSCVWFGLVHGIRNLLLLGCVLFGVAEFLIPWAPHLSLVLALQFIAGLGSGVFIPLTIGIVFRGLPQKLWVYGIAAYAMNIVLSLNVAATIEGWYSEHASWHWLFWQNAVLAVPLFALFWFALPAERTNRQMQKVGDHTGIALMSVGLALIFAALDQGDRLDWWNSQLIVLLALAGIGFVGLFLVHESFLTHTGVDFSLLARRNIVFFVLFVVLIRYLVTSSNLLTTNFLVQVRGLRPLQAGEALLWLALPQFLVAPAVAWLLTRIDPRIVIATGVGVTTVAFVMLSQLTSAWSESSFAGLLLLQAMGETAALIAMIYFLTRHLALSPLVFLGIGAFLQTARLFGGELGTAAITVFTRKFEQINSNLVGLHVGADAPATIERLRLYATQVGAAQDGGIADGRILGLLANAVRTQAFTLAYADGFAIAAGVAMCALLIAFLMRDPPPQPPAPVAPPPR